LRFQLQFAGLEIDLNIWNMLDDRVDKLEGLLVQGSDLRAPGMLTHHPFFVFGSLH